MPPRILLLDVMGTLVHDPFYDEIPAHFGTTLEALLAEKDPRAWLDFEHGTIGEEELFERFFRDRRAVDGEALKTATFEAYALLPGIEELLAELRAAGVELHALSNYSVWYRAIDERTRLSRFLRWSFVSCDTGLRKPDARAYEHALETLDATPREALFVDDREANVRAARALGIGALAFEGAGALRGELARLGVLTPSP